MSDQEEREPLVLDTSVLLNFVNIREVALLDQLDRPLVMPDEVLEEVTRPQQRHDVVDAMSAGILMTETITDPREVALVAELRDDGRLGAGECAVLAISGSRNWSAAIQDGLAQAVGRARFPSLDLWETEDIVRRLIQAGHITAQQADDFLVEWRTHHRFSSRVTTFRHRGHS